MNEDSGYIYLQKSAQIVDKLREGVPQHQGYPYMCYFDNWFSTLELFIYFGRIGINAAGTIRTKLSASMPFNLKQRSIETRVRIL